MGMSLIDWFILGISSCEIVGLYGSSVGFDKYTMKCPPLQPYVTQYYNQHGFRRCITSILGMW